MKRAASWTRIATWTLFAAALLLALAFRLSRPDARPMHHDEANQAVRFGHLLETGEYRYDRNDHHGPTLYYFTLPAAWISGRRTLDSLDERTLRTVPALFGAGTILLFALLAPGLGRAAVAMGAILAAISPALTYYSRFYIQEPLFAFFAVAFLVAVGRYATSPGPAGAVAAGLLAGLLYSTKETSIIVIATTLAACVTSLAVANVRARGHGSGRLTRSGHRRAAVHVVAALAAASSVALLAYSSFGTHPAGIAESYRSFGVYLRRGVEAGAHAHPWHYYAATLSWSSSGGLVWSEASVLVLAAIGTIAAFAGRRAGFWPKYVALYSILTAVAFSLLRYKTPWNLLSFHAGFVVMAGFGCTALFELARRRAARLVFAAVLVLVCVHLATQNWRASFRYPADPRNPYAYAQTSTDFLRLVKRVEDLAEVHPEGSGMLVKVIAGPYEQWPIPWYLRRMESVGYWTSAASAGDLAGTPVVIASLEEAEAATDRLGPGYVSEFYGLRPGVLLTLNIERGLWERFAASRTDQR